MTQALYNKLRPQVWDEVVGQNHIVQTLRNAVRAQKVAHAYLFAGPRGTGKTTVARILAKAVNCASEDLGTRPCNRCKACISVNEGRYLDLIEIDAASNTSVEDVRDLRERVTLAPNEGGRKVYLIDEVHMLSTAAFNALLKTLEEPPSHVLFILATTEIHKLPATVVSRCQRHEFHRLGGEEIASYLRKVAEAERIDASPEALRTIARQATGSLRDALSLLDQMASLGGHISQEAVLSLLGAAAWQATQDLVMCLARGDLGEGLRLIHATIDSGADTRQFARQIVDYLRGVLLEQMGSEDLVEAPAETQAAMGEMARLMGLSQIVRAIRAFNVAAADTRVGWRPELPLELAFLETVGVEGGAKGGAVPPATSAAQAGTATNERRPPLGLGQEPTVRTPANHGQAPATRVRDEKAAMPESRRGPGLSLTRISEIWPRVLSLLRERDTRAHTLFGQGHLYSFEGEVLSLTFESELPRAKAARPETVAAVQGVLAEVIGKPLRVRCVLGRPSGSGGLPERIEGGMVDTATRELGAHSIDLP
ncbi:MAG: DNA polymerase III subunit gamma/tau [Anaerolineales bacterium]|jgi:DNA polymerase-3 subunit gamma/tau